MVDPRDMIGHDGDPSDKEDGAGKLRTFGPALDLGISCIMMHFIWVYTVCNRERSGSVVECLT